MVSHSHSHTHKNQKDIEKEKLLKERLDSIKYYETFINETLNVDLNKSIEDREKVLENLENYLELKSNIELLIENKMDSMKTMINLGSECYVKARVQDTSYIYVDIGLGIHVKYTLEEAIKFINEKETFLNKTVENQTKKINQIKTKIDLIQNGLKELKHLE
ncbi:hypothetical protein ACTFIW_002140 [Dictyostelium discoideum]